MVKCALMMSLFVWCMSGASCVFEVICVVHHLWLIVNLTCACDDCLCSAFLVCHNCLITRVRMKNLLSCTVIDKSLIATFGLIIATNILKS